MFGQVKYLSWNWKYIHLLLENSDCSMFVQCTYFGQKDYKNTKESIYYCTNGRAAESSRVPPPPPHLTDLSFYGWLTLWIIARVTFHHKIIVFVHKYHFLLFFLSLLSKLWNLTWISTNQQIIHKGKWDDCFADSFKDDSHFTFSCKSDYSLELFDVLGNRRCGEVDTQFATNKTWLFETKIKND